MSIFKKHWKKLVILLAVVGIAYFVFRQKQIPTSATYIPNKDNLVQPKVQDIKDEIVLAGSIKANDIAVLSFPTAGKVSWVGVKLGDHVRKYQAIATLDKSQLQKQLQTDFNLYRTTLSQFQDTQDQYQQLKDKYLLTDADKRILDRVQWNLENSVTQYEIQDIILRNATLVSPIEGIVIAIDQPIAGINIIPTAATFTIVNPNSIYFRSEIDQDSVNSISLNQSATITIDSHPDQTIDSKVSYISFFPVQGQTSTVYEVRFSLPVDNKNLSYRLGMDGDASILIQEKTNVMTIPTDTIYSDNNQNYVWVKSAKSNSLSKVFITTGIETDTITEVLSGLSGNENIVIKKI